MRARLATLAVVILLVRLAAAQDEPPSIPPPPVLRLEAAALGSRDVVIDGDPAEWSDRAQPIEIGDASQSVSLTGPDRDWGGPQDLSGTLWIGTTDRSLVIGGKIIDDQLFTAPGHVLWEGDSIELFFDLDLTDANERYDGDDFQMVLSPLSPTARWTVANLGQASGVLDGGLEGVRVEGRPLIGEGDVVLGYTFEFELPFANFPGLVVAKGREIGFSIALVDAEDGPGQRAYLTVDGQSSLSRFPDRFARLRFNRSLAEPSASELPSDDSIWRSLLLPTVALIALALVFVLRRPLQRVVRMRLVVKAIGVAVLVLIYLGASIAPGMIEDAQRDDQLARLDRAAPVLAATAQEANASGLMRSQSLSDRLEVLRLLRGRAVVRPPEREFHQLWARTPVPTRTIDATEAIPFLEYARPVTRGAPVEVALPGTVADELSLVLSYATIRSARADVDVDPGLEIAAVTVLFDDPSLAMEKTITFGVDILDADRAVEDGSPTAATTRPAWRREKSPKSAEEIRIALDPALRGEPLRAVRLESKTGAGVLTLHAVTTIDRQGRPSPVAIGGVARTGIPYLVADGRPADARVTLRSDDGGVGVHAIDVPQLVGRVDRAWLLLTVHPDDRPSFGAPVGTVRFVGTTGPPIERALRFGVDLDHHALFTARHRAGTQSAIAFRWDRFHLDEIEVAFEDPRWIQRIEFEAAAGGPTLEVAAVTLGTPKARRAAPTGSLVALDEGGAATLTDFGRTELAGFDGFAVARAGRVLGAESDSADVRARLVGSFLGRDVTAALESGESRTETRIIEGREIHVAWVPGIRRDDAVGVWIDVVPDTETRTVAAVVRFSAIAIAAPLVLLVAVDILGRLRRLRVKLVMAFGISALVPLLLLFLGLREVVLDPLEEGRRDQVARRAAEVVERMRRLADDVDRQAAIWAQDEELRGAMLLADREEARQRIEQRLDEFGATTSVLPSWRPHLALTVAGEDGETTFPSGAENPLVRWIDPPAGLGYLWSRLAFKGIGDGVDAERSWRLVADFPLDRAFAAGLKRSLGDQPELLLYTPGGLPIVSTVDFGDEGSVAHAERKRAVVAEIRRRNAPVLREVERAAGRFLVAYDVLTSPSGDVVGLLGVAAPQDAVVAARAQFRDLFVGLAAAAILLEILIGSLVTRRITGPVLELEQLARHMEGGRLDARADTRELTDEVGALARSFNRMADQLARRIGEMRRLNAGMQELMSRLDRRGVIESARRALKEASGVQEVHLLLVDRETGRLDPVTLRRGRGARETLAAGEGVIAEVLQARTPRRLLDIPSDDRPTGEVEELFFGSTRGAVVLPLVLGERCTGVALLLHDAPIDAEQVNDEFLATLAGQIAAALENARLYHLAIEDPQTGLYVHSYFMSRLGQEVERAIESNRPLSLITWTIEGFETLHDRHGPDASRRVIREVVTRARSAVSRMYLIASSGRESIEILLPETDKRTAMEVAERIRRSITGSAISLGDDSRRGFRPTLAMGLATCPEDARSSEFLLGEAERAMRRAREDRSTAVIGIESETREIEQIVPRDAGGFVFRSRKMIEILETIDRIARSDVSILVQGETGVGKEVVAEMIHRRSHRRDQPHVKVNCAALPEPLLESELFGHERGAFTGADSRQIGRFETAHGGTIFLDEIGEMSLSTQVKILRVLEDKRIERLGGGTPRRVDVRVIAATNRDLREMIREGTFREDLYFRLNVVAIVVPPLRARKEEIPGLVDRFFSDFNEANATGIDSIAPEAMDSLYRHDWPGNVRELKNTVERAMVIAEGTTIRPIHLQLETMRAPKAPADRLPVAPAPVAASPTAELTERQSRLVEILRTRRSITNHDYAEIMNVSDRTGLRDLRDLMERGVIVRIGSRRAAEYRLA